MSEQRLIDANKLEVLYAKWISQLVLEGDKGDKRGVEACLAALKASLAIEAEPVRHGKWENNTGYDDWHCSECGFEINYDGEYPTEYDNFKFCGCCGAKMDKDMAEKELMRDIAKETKEAIWGDGSVQNPMTLEELLQMNGKPVFIIEDGAEAGWELAEEAEEYFLERNADEYGITWFAYRMEPEEVRRE